MLQAMETQPKVLFEHLFGLLDTYPGHLERSAWINAQIASPKSHLPLNTVLCVHDSDDLGKFIRPRVKQNFRANTSTNMNM